jgi:lipoyl(octanoyl) transferase
MYVEKPINITNLLSDSIINLNRFATSLEQCVIDTLATYDVQAGRSPVNTGVWVGCKKICALGVTASRWITMHGIAVNLNTDLTHFSQIIPCGIDPQLGGVTRLQDLQGGETIDIKEFTSRLLKSFSNTYNLQMEVESDPQGLFDELKDRYPEVSANELVPIQ